MQNSEISRGRSPTIQVQSTCEARDQHQEPVSESRNHDWIKTTCAYCGVGCGVEARMSDGALEVRGDRSHPANFGRLCSKGLALGETVTPEGRMLYPSVDGKRSSWRDALNVVAEKFEQAIRDHGPDSVAFYVSGQLLTEDYYVANKLMKGFIGSANIDTNSRLCMSSTVAGQVRAFGSDTMPGCYEDLELADLVVLTGSNLAWCHPVLYQRLKSARQSRPHMKVVVIDPRRTETCEIADLHLTLAPGSDVALFNGLLRHLVETGKVDTDYIQEHTEGFSRALVEAMGRGAIDEVSRIADVDCEDLRTFYDWFADTEKTVTVYSQGVNQSSQGSAKVNSIINCHLATGRVGKPGCGPFSVTGQPNAMGGREAGGMANTLAAHMDFSQPENLERVARFWGTDTLAQSPGLKAVDLFDAVADGSIKVLWIMATNPAVSMPDADRVTEALKACPTVIVSDCIANTDTTRCADILLPATAWGEKSGTVTNSERRISRQRAVLPPVAEARPDWWIISEVANAMGFGYAFNYESERAVFIEYAALTALGNNGSRDLDLSGLSALSHKEYDEFVPRQWPVRNGDSQGSRRFFGDGRFFTPSAKAQFICTSWHPPLSEPDAGLPLVLNTGRIRDQWHTMTRTGRAARLTGHVPEPFVSMHPADMERYQLVDSGLAEISSPRGFARVRVQRSDTMRPGEIFMPMHWTGMLSSHGRVSALIASNADPVSGQPELKYTPVSVQPWVCQSEAFVVSRQGLRESLEAEPLFGYWAEQRIDGGLAYYLASTEAPELLQVALERLRPQGIDFELVNFSNTSTGEHRVAVGDRQQLLFASLVGSHLRGRELQWLASLLNEKLDVTARRAIITGEASGELATGRIICSCNQVGYKQICSAIREDGVSNVKAIGAVTAAGTGCGSCVPELQRILALESQPA